MHEKNNLQILQRYKSKHSHNQSFFVTKQFDICLLNDVTFFSRLKSKAVQNYLRNCEKHPAARESFIIWN